MRLPLKRLLAGTIAVVLSGACLLALRALGALDLGVVLGLRYNKLALLGAALCNVAVAFGAIVRYRLLLQIVGVRLPLSLLIRPNLVAQAVGTWLPAPMAVTEALRLSMTLGGTSGGAPDELLARRARITVASLVDRVLGLGAMLLAGGTAGLWLVVSGSAIASRTDAVLVFSGISIGLGVVLLLLPLAGRFRWPARLAVWMAGWRPHRGRGRWLASVMESLSKAAEDIAAPTWGLVAPGMVSVCLLLGTCGSYYLPGLATPHPLSFTALVVGVPLLSLSTVLPLGFAGIGSQQLLALGVFSIFALDGASVVTASLVQNSLSIATTTTLGVFAAFLPAIVRWSAG